MDVYGVGFPSSYCMPINILIRGVLKSWGVPKSPWVSILSHGFSWLGWFGGTVPPGLRKHHIMISLEFIGYDKIEWVQLMDIDEQFIGSPPPQRCHEMHRNGHPRSKSRLVHGEHRPETMVESALKSEDSIYPLVNIQKTTENHHF